MRKAILLVSIICIFATFAFGQKTVRSFRKKIAKQKKIEQAKSENVEVKRENLPKISPQSLYDVPLKILYKPIASYPNQDKGAICLQGVVRLRVAFLENGKIGNITPVGGLPYGATENAIEAAKLIKFKPAMKNGKPVTVTKVVEYSFKIY